MQNIRAFSQHHHIVATLSKGAISSIPRWRYAIEMEKKVSEGADYSESDGEYTYASFPVCIKGRADAKKEPFNQTSKYSTE